MNLDDALTQIADIRMQMARTRVFRGYRSTTTLFSSLVAVVFASLQAIYVPEPRHHIDAYLALWFGAAVACIFVTGIEVAVRYWRTDSSLQKELTLLAVEQFLPCLVVGALLTFVLSEEASDALWLAPALWAILFGLGIFASRRLLPAAVKWVGGFYLLCGLLEIAMGRRIAFGPLEMAIPFGVGQAMAAIVLYWNLERSHAGK